MRCSGAEVSGILIALLVMPVVVARIVTARMGTEVGRAQIIAVPAVGFAVSVIVLIGFSMLSLRCGALEIDASSAWNAMFNYDNTIPDQIVVRELRVPRTILGIAAGACLAVAGALTQGVTRNPLGAPGILGVNAGASFAIVTAIFVLGVVSPLGYVWFAFAGAAGTAALVYAVASAGPGGATPVKLALAGAVVSALLGAWTTSLLLLDQETLDQARFWLAGSLAGRDTDELRLLFPFIIVALVVGVFMGRQVNALSLGDDVAAGLGQRTALVRGLAGLCVVVLAGSAVAIAGPVGFVGLAIPHVARSLVGPDYRWVLAYSLVLGPCLLLGSDVLGRVLERPSEVQVGIVTAALGAPFLIYLVRFTKLAEL
ncbi:MAG: iron ABC transporter permease [Actinomycetota bacterium]